jgi:hypothetical protein
MMILHETSSLSETFASIGRLYEIVNIKNQVVDGHQPYPEDTQAVNNGMAIEFMFVVFVSLRDRNNMVIFSITETCPSSTLAAVAMLLGTFRSKLSQVSCAFWWDLTALVNIVTLFSKLCLLRNLQGRALSLNY